MAADLNQNNLTMRFSLIRLFFLSFVNIGYGFKTVAWENRNPYRTIIWGISRIVNCYCPSHDLMLKTAKSISFQDVTKYSRSYMDRSNTLSQVLLIHNGTLWNSEKYSLFLFVCYLSQKFLCHWRILVTRFCWSALEVDPKDGRGNIKIFIRNFNWRNLIILEAFPFLDCNERKLTKDFFLIRK